MEKGLKVGAQEHCLGTTQKESTYQKKYCLKQEQEKSKLFSKY